MIKPAAVARIRRETSVAAATLPLVLLAAACGVSRDLGTSMPRGPLPVDDRNPIVLANDGIEDNWQGEYAMLLAHSGGAKLAGIIVNASRPWPDIDANVAGWRGLVSAAVASGMRHVPDVTVSIGRALVRPASGRIEDTSPNRSEGARLILDVSKRLALSYRPVVVVTGGRLTDVADAYLIDPTVAERVVVVSSLGTITASGAAMAAPNGEMDPWADSIVSSRFTFVQVSAYYNQTSDIPTSRLAELPANPFGAWIAAKQPNVWTLTEATDQVAVLASGLPSFVTEVQRVSPAGISGAGANAGPDLVTDPNGRCYLVTRIASTEGAARVWKALLSPATFAP